MHIRLRQSLGHLRLRSWIAALFAALLLLGGAVLTPQGSVLADDIDDAIAEMKAFAKAKDDGKCIAKMVELQDSLDGRVTKAFGKLVKSRQPKIAAAAVRQLAARKDAAFGKTVGKKITDKKLYKSKDGVLRPVYIAYLDAAADYANPRYGDDLSDMVRKFLQTDSEYATKAIKAFGMVQSKGVVDQLIKWLTQTESRGQNQGGKYMGKEARENYAKAKRQIIATLEELTGESIGDAQSWTEFWDNERKKFEFPDLNAPEVDPSTLDEWTDAAYGYTVKKPDGPGWAFKKTEWDAIRMRLEKADDDEMVLARVDFQIHNLSSQSPKTIKELAEWYAQDFKDNRFSDLRGKEPTIEERRIGGRDFWIISAKGDSGGSYRGWSTAEMRAYLTKVGRIVVRMEGTARLGAEEADREALWNVIEKASWSK